MSDEYDCAQVEIETVRQLHGDEAPTGDATGLTMRTVKAHQVRRRDWLAAFGDWCAVAYTALIDMGDDVSVHLAVTNLREEERTIEVLADADIAILRDEAAENSDTDPCPDCDHTATGRACTGPDVPVRRNRD